MKELCRHLRDRPAGARTAFTLVELIVVMGIVSILTALALPAFTQINRASGLTNSAALIVDQLTRARLEALSQNRVVEVRFYKIPGEVSPTLAYRAFRVFVYDEKVQIPTPLTKVFPLSAGFIVLDDKSFSTLISPDTNSRVLNPPTDTIPSRSDPVAYQAFRFRPSGGTDLDPNGTSDGDKWFLTVKAETESAADGQPGRNYITAVVDPVVGRIRTFRP